MVDLGNVTKGNINNHNLNWPQIVDHSQKILVIGDTESRKINALLNMIKQKDDDDYIALSIKIYLYSENPY